MLSSDVSQDSQYSMATKFWNSHTLSSQVRRQMAADSSSSIRALQ